MNIIDKIKCNTKIASDNNWYLIELFKNKDKIQFLPDVVTKELYNECRCAYYNNDFTRYEPGFIAAIGFLSSYSGRFYDGGFNGQGFLDGRTKRNYYNESKRNLLKQITQLSNIKFQYGDYENLYTNQKDCLFYCDIPYQNVKQYSTSIDFNYDRFWNWAERMSENNFVIVSEYNAPENWECIWKKDLLKTMNHGNNVKSTEKLFRIKK